MIGQRIQHAVLIFSFFLLVLTGFPVTFPEAPGAAAIVALLGGFTVRSALHRFGAVLLISLTVYHFSYTVTTPRGRSELRAFIPRLKDGFDLIHILRYYFGLAKDKPKFDRYNFIEKFEYLALGWGSVVMIATGLMLWFEEQSLAALPKWMLDVAKVVHSYEAMLAFLAIIIWHFYNVHLNPEVFPMSKVWLTGMISEHEMKAHHPLEYERLMRSLAADVVRGKTIETELAKQAELERNSGD
jgi:cytochrome b subunit of formate dehydrogenase